MSSTITLENVGPIESLSIPIPEDGGLVVLKGPNGSGKSHGIEAVESLYNKDARKGLRNSDGTPAGLVEGLGVKVRLGRSNTAKGELVCESLDGRIDPSVLVDPGIKDPVSADTKRLATVIRLAGIHMDRQRWESAIDGGIAEAIDLPSLIDDDPIVTAERIRRKVHELALATERKAERSKAEADALRESVADVDVSIPCDADELSKALEEATATLAAHKQQRLQALENEKKWQEAKKQLAENESKAIDTEKADAALEEAIETLAFKREQITQLREQLQKLELEAKELESKESVARERLELAKQQQQQLDKWREIVNADQMAIVSEEEIAQLEIAKQKAQEALVLGDQARRATKTLNQVGELQTKSLIGQKEAKQLRELARSTDTILEDALREAGFTQIKVSHSRLCVESDRGLEPFAELSHGERWTLALDLAARGLPKGAVLPVCQEAYESLDPQNRQFVNRLAKERGLVIITAEASDGELRAEVAE